MSTSIEEYDAVVVGAGAAGLMCAVEAGKRGLRVLVVDHADRPGKKILISGGGRCNFTNLYCGRENFLSDNPHFATSALARYTPDDFIALVESHGIVWHEKTLGQLFCDGPAAQIVAMLLAECAAAAVRIVLRTSITRVDRGDSSGFVMSSEAATFRCEKLVIATGGLSIPKMGATAFGYDVARQFGLKIVEPRPALVPLILSDEDRAGLCDLAGVSAEVAVAAGGQSFREKLLVTHRGVSGPAVLQASSYWRPGEPVALDWTPEGGGILDPLFAKNVRRDPSAVKAALRTRLPARLAERLADLAGVDDWTNAGIAALERRVRRWEFTPAGTEGYDKAEVTAGGVSTAELSGQTMEAKRVPGLYFIGEVVDVTGHLGGFNFQWAWASGAAAGRAL